MSDAPKSTYLPNLVGGVSMWKLAHDLNEAKFMDGRLLVPETEGSDSLPVTVRWKLEGLVPLREARARFAPEAATAIADFIASVKRVEAELGDPKSGYAKYKSAFTLPAMDGEGDAYFFDPISKKLSVINWGASPRSLGGREEFVFGYGSFDKLFAGAAVASVAEVVAPPGEVAPAVVAPVDGEKKDDKKPEEKKEKKPGLFAGRWWIWLLAAVAIALLLALLFFFLRGCEEARDALDAGSNAAMDAGADAAVLDGGADAAADDAGVDAGNVDAGGADAGADAAAADAGKDASAESSDAGGDKPSGDGSGDGPASGDGSGNGDGPGIGGKIRVVPGGPLVPVESLPHRAHFHPDAVKWKVASGDQFLAAGSPREGNGHTFNVVLKPGSTFEQVTVLWQDRKGVWHQ